MVYDALLEYIICTVYSSFKLDRLHNRPIFSASLNY